MMHRFLIDKNSEQLNNLFVDERPNQEYLDYFLIRHGFCRPLPCNHISHITIADALVKDSYCDGIAQL